MIRLANSIVAPALLVASLGGCNGPLAMIPGGALRGTVTPYPSSWDFASEVVEIALETDSKTPHSVTTWSAVSSETLYISTSLLYGSEVPASRDWVQDVLRDDAVRVRINARIFEGCLKRVLAPSEREAVMERFIQKYELESNARTDAAWVFRLSSRATELGAAEGTR